MSFASLCKEELMGIKRNPLENKALILGMILSGASLNQNEIIFASTNVEITNYFDFLMKRVYHLVGTNFESDLNSKLFNHTYESKFNLTNEIVDELEIYKHESFREEIKEKANLKASYLCGAFLARGSVNDPNTSKYHFEITLGDPVNAIFVQHILNECDFNSKIIKRRNKFVVYLKDAEKIVDCLRLIGANKNAFHYEDIRIERDFNNSINRVINCEVANEAKSLKAAREQLRYIKYLEYNYPLEKLDPKILTLMKVRQDNPEASLIELIDILHDQYGETISKPGLSHRFRKIKELATEHYNNRG